MREHAGLRSPLSCFCRLAGAAAHVLDTHCRGQAPATAARRSSKAATAGAATSSCGETARSGARLASVSDKRVLVTGGTGMVGYCIVQSLLARGHRVRALVRS